MFLRPLCILAALTASASAQDLDLAKVQKDLDYVFDRPPGRVDPQVVQERFVAFWKKYEGKDLGRLSYARGLSHFWNRERDKAIAAFDKWLAKHDPAKITAPEQRMTIGRAYLSRTVQLARAEKLDKKAYLAAARNFARCYDDMVGVVQHVTKHIDVKNKSVKAEARVIMAREVLAKKMAVKEADRVLRAIFASDPVERRR